MNIKNPTNIIIFHGGFLECESLMELRSGVTEEEWFAVCKETIETYCYMRVAGDLGPAKMSKQDSKLVKRLRETIEMLKQLDPDNLGTLDLETLTKEHVGLIEKEWKNVQKSMKIAHDRSVGNADIYVSDI